MKTLRPIEVSGRVGQIQSPGTPEDQKWIYTIAIEGIDEVHLGPFDTQHDAVKQGRNTCFALRERIESKPF